MLSIWFAISEALGEAGGSSPMSFPITATGRFYGFVELKADGTVLYARVENGDDWASTVPDFRGRNFYNEWVPFDNVEELHDQLDAFHRGSEPLEVFTFNCRYRDGAVPVKILLARVCERADQGVTKSILVYIKKVQ